MMNKDVQTHPNHLGRTHKVRIVVRVLCALHCDTSLVYYNRGYSSLLATDVYAQRASAVGKPLCAFVASALVTQGLQALKH